MAEDYPDYGGWFQNQHPYPDLDEDEITSGIRRKAWLPCQYWITGMSVTCKYWQEGDPGKCEFDFTEQPTGGRGRTDPPSGYNFGLCDYLGRQSGCDKYEAVEGASEDLDVYMCVAPNVVLSGLIKVKNMDADGRITEVEIVKKSNIIGYNPGTCLGGACGQCDGQGLGRYPSASSGSFADLLEIRPRCNYFRPWQIGFGAIEPHKIVYDPTSGIVDRKGSYALALVPMLRRLPMQFRMLNVRSRAQKCQYWDRAYGSQFVLETDDTVDVDDASIFSGGTVNNACTATNPAAREYADRMDPSGPTISNTMFSKVWAKKDEAGNYVCNGAKPECPCYTGEWLYCTDEGTREGTPITAEQILELRYWEYDWATEEDYEKFYTNRHNKHDLNVSNSNIYTFTKWNRLGETASLSVMEGNKIKLCQPTPSIGKRFIPDNHLQKTQILYSPAGIATGTPNESGNEPSVSFPSLIRAIDEVSIKPFHILYPYPHENPTSPTTVTCATVQQKTPFVKKTCSTDSDSIMVFGASVRNITMYAFNTLFFSNVSQYFTTYENGISVPSDEREDFYAFILNWLEQQDNEGSKYFFKTQTNTTDGFFEFGPIELKPQKLNTLIIIADFGDDTVDFQKRNVWSQWYGGMTIQTSFNQSYGSDYYIAADPYSLSPSANIEAHGVVMYGSNPYGFTGALETAFSVHSRRKETQLATTSYYSYCEKKETVTENAQFWGGLQGTSKVWGSIDNINLNYLFDWEVEEIKMMPKAGTAMCGEEISEIVMELVYPSVGSEQTYIDPNAFLCEPQDSSIKVWFRSDEWDLSVKYNYTYYANDITISDGVEIVWPTFGENVVFTGPAHSISVSEEQISVTGILTNTIKVMTYFTDEKGRLMSAFATKLCTAIGAPECRNVEISYGYQVGAEVYNLEPSAGWSVVDSTPLTSVKTGDGSIVSLPPCGDHDISGGTQTGSMWYPFDNCSSIIQYDQWSNAAYCSLPIEGQTKGNHSRDDYRFMGPHQYNAWATERGLWLAACSPQWNFWYSKAKLATTVFTGNANIRGGQISLYYSILGEALPPFGDNTREHFERWISHDYESYLANGVKAKSQYMPMMIDNTSFFMSFNAFDGTDTIDAFGYVNQMNFYLANFLNETFPKEDDRLNFEELFTVVPRGFSSYPSPLVYRHDRESSVYVHYYIFKEDDIAWAWQEHWEDIERAQNDTDKLTFVDFDKPDYVWSLYKEEHRIITDEDTHTIKFIPPQFKDGVITSYPSIQLDDGEPRYFEIDYTNYDSELTVEWKDESTNGAVGGSGGEEESGIYEKTSSATEWWVPINMIFDENATGDAQPEGGEELSRQIVFAYDPWIEYLDKRYYNRGIIANISRRALKNLPYEIYLALDEVSDTQSISENYSGTSLSMTHDGPIFKGNLVANFVLDEPTAGVVEIEFTGKWGIHQDTIAIPNKFMRVSKPSFNITVYYESGWYTTYTTSSVSAVSQFVSNEQNIQTYTVSATFPTTPAYMIKEKVISIQLVAVPNGSEYAAINGTDDSVGVRIKIARYKEAKEDIKVWERKFRVSRSDDLSGSSILNLHGPDNILMPDLSGENAGQYFPDIGTYPQKIDNARSKIHQFGATEEKPNTVSIDININNISTIEQEEQEKLWETARELDQYSTQNFSIIIPPGLTNFLKQFNVFYSISPRAVFVKDLLPWSNHYIILGYTEGVLWHPGGHKFIWSDKYHDEKCLVRDAPRPIADGLFQHVAHAGGYGEEVLDPYRALYWLKGSYTNSRTIMNAPKYAGAEGSGLNVDSYG